VIWSIEAQCLLMALRLPLQTVGTLGTSFWQLQVALRPYTSRKGSGRRVIGRIFSMDEKRAVVKEAYARSGSFLELDRWSCVVSATNSAARMEALRIPYGSSKPKSV
jgi:hypothetical protein